VASLSSAYLLVVYGTVENGPGLYNHTLLSGPLAPFASQTAPVCLCMSADLMLVHVLRYFISLHSVQL
jgi:hypothetical protein